MNFISNISSIWPVILGPWGIFQPESASPTSIIKILRVAHFVNIERPIYFSLERLRGLSPDDSSPRKAPMVEIPALHSTAFCNILKWIRRASFLWTRTSSSTSDSSSDSTGSRIRRFFRRFLSRRMCCSNYICSNCSRNLCINGRQWNGGETKHKTTQRMACLCPESECVG